MSGEQKVNPLFAALWGVWFFGAVIGYFQASWWAAAAAGAAFGLLEAAGVARDGPGDTYTEQIRAFYGGKPARAFFVIGSTGFLGMWILSFVRGLEYFHLWAGVSLVGGLVFWVLPHFLKRDGAWG